MSSTYKSEKVRLISIIEALDLKAESTLLNDEERLFLRNDNVELANLFEGMRRLNGHKGQKLNMCNRVVAIQNISISLPMVNIEKRKKNSIGGR
jgi:hypothetical protein